MSTHPPRLHIVGLDGATFDLIEPWVRVGELPNLARLIRGGSIGRLASTVPAVTLPAWSSFLTGKNLGKHGIFDFSVHLPESYGLRFVNASDRVGPTFWRLLSQAGRRVCSLWVPATYPPELVNGIVVSGFDSPVARTMDASFVYPAELFGELRNAVGALRLGVLQQFRIGPGWHERALAKLLDGMETKARLAEHLLTRGPWDCFMVVFGESDTVAHHFWMFHDPDSPRRIPGESGVLRDAIRLVYRRLDAIVGRLLALLPGETVTVVVSDHGAGGAGTMVLHLNAWLEQQGFLQFRAPSVLRRGLGRAKRLGLDYLPGPLQDACFRWFGGGVANWLEGRSRFGGIAWEGTRAYSEELNHAPSIWINLAGRQGAGTVPPREYERVREALISALGQWRDPRSGDPVVRRAYRREELYRGPYVGRSPDLVLDLNLAGGYSYSCLPTPRGDFGSTRSLAQSEYRGAKGQSMNGSHRPEGVLILNGPGIREGKVIGGATIEDVVPTLLRLVGLPLPAELDGRLIRGAVERSLVPASVEASTDVFPSYDYTPGEQARVRRRLESLGYF